MRGSWVIPIMFGILFFSAVFSAQNVYGPHFTTFDGLRYNFQGTGGNSFFDVFVELSDGHANPKKAADFELCVHLTSAQDTTIQTEIVALSLVSCEPINLGPSDRKGFTSFQFTIPSDRPIETSSMIADISGFIELRNPADQSTGGTTEFVAENIILGVLACVPPNCEGLDQCSGHGVCVADNTCECEKGWEQNADCSVPQCDENIPCPDDGNHCTQTVCHSNQCVSFDLPECNPNQLCTSNDECTAPDECTVSFCNSLGSCQNEPIPGCEVCEITGPEVCDGFDNDCNGEIDEGFELGTACAVGAGVCERIGVVVCDSSGTGSTCSVSPGVPTLENDAATCADGIDNDCDGLTDCTDSACIALGITCSLPFCTPNTNCDDTNPCTVDSCDEINDQCTFTPIQCPTGLTCNPSTGACETACNPTTTNPDESIDGLCNGVDDNCDGNIDEGCGCTIGTTISCGSSVGECQQGTQTCNANGQFGACVGEIGPSTEVCDLRDNDCDNLTDEGVHATTNTPSTAIDLGSWCTDTRSDTFCPSNSFGLFSTQTGNTGKFFSVTARECSDCPADLEMRFDLLVPSGINYNLFVYDSSMTLLSSSVDLGNDQVIVNIPEDVTTETNVNLIVEVRYRSGISCDTWTLNSYNMR